MAHSVRMDKHVKAVCRGVGIRTERVPEYFVVPRQVLLRGFRVAAGLAGEFSGFAVFAGLALELVALRLFVFVFGVLVVNVDRSVSCGRSA